MKELTQEQLDLLKKPLDAKAIKPHPTKTYLSSIKAIYVTERMNEVFGVGQWQTKVSEVSHDSNNGMVVVKVEYSVPEYGIFYESFGGNDNGGSGSKNFDLGDAYKGATTDAITKIGSYLGIAIDVFKGEATSTQPTSQEDNKPWLNEGSDIWKAALERKPTLETLRENYKVSKKTADLYLSLIK